MTTVKKLIIAFIVALSAAFALDVISKTTVHNTAAESADDHKTHLFLHQNNYKLRPLN